MNRDDRHPTRTMYHELNGGSAPSTDPPSWPTMTMFAALPLIVIAAASFPTAAAVTLAALAGVVVGAALRQRYPNGLTRAIPSPARESSAIRRR